MKDMKKKKEKKGHMKDFKLESTSSLSNGRKTISQK